MTQEFSSEPKVGEATGVTLWPENQFAAAFTEWDRRYREDPAGFESDMSRIMRGQDIEEYGQGAAAYFAEIMRDLDPS